MAAIRAIQISLYALVAIAISSTAMAQDDATATFNTNVFSGVSTPALVTQNYSYLVLGICAAIFVVVMTMGIITLIRFRKRPGDDDREPPQIYGSNPLEMAWTVIPLITVLVLSLVTVRAISEIQIDQQPEGWMPVTATGHQWWWEFHYPEYGITTANELHVPVSNTQLRKPTFVTPGVRRCDSQLLDPAFGWQDRCHPEPAKPHVDQPAQDRTVRGPMLGVLRYPTREHASTGLRPYPRRISTLGRGTAAGRSRGRGGPKGS